MTIEEAKRAHQDRLMALAGVVSVGIGLDERRAPVIKVGVADLADAAAVAAIPRSLDGHPVEVFEAGTLRAQ